MAVRKHVVSVSLGTSKRDKASEIEILGQPFLLERRGTDGDLDRFARTFAELDGKVDALGVGGADIYVVVENRRYAFKQIQRLIQGAVQTPVVDGSGLKHTLEREAIARLQANGDVDFKMERVLLVSAVDRFGMAQALDQYCPDVIYGDLMFALGLNIPLRKYSQVRTLGRLILPIVTRLPFKWFYPTGTKQEERKPMFGGVFQERTLIAGDWHFIRRHAPERMPGKTIITQTLRHSDFEMLRAAEVRRVITTTPEICGETFATNVMEAVIVALLEKMPEQISQQDYADVLARLGWNPHVVDLSGTLKSSFAAKETDQ